jgi:hypothetical protein
MIHISFREQTNAHQIVFVTNPQTGEVKQSL